MMQYLSKDIDIWCNAPQLILCFINLCCLSCTWACRSYSSLLSLFFSLSFSLNLNSPTPTYVSMYLSTWQYWVDKCNLSDALLYCYVLVTSGCQAVTWCPAGVILNSCLVSRVGGLWWPLLLSTLTGLAALPHDSYIWWWCQWLCSCQPVR
jgi:hypothetical protein